MNIIVKIKEIYGESRVYVADPEKAKLFAELTNTKTLTLRHIEALGRLGYTFAIEGHDYDGAEAYYQLTQVIGVY